MDYLTYLNKALDLEETGYATEALLLMDKLRSVFPEQQDFIFLEHAKMKFRNSYEKDALLDFLVLYERTQAEELFQLILQAYVAPDQETVFQKNQRLMKGYPHFYNYNRDKDATVIPIWRDEEIIICANLETKQFATTEHKEDTYEFAPDTAIMVVNELWMDRILYFEMHSRMKLQFLDKQLPMYLVFDQIYWELFAGLYDLHALVETRRIVFLVGRDSVCQYLKGEMVIVPQKIYASQKDEEKAYHNVIENVKAYILRKWQDSEKKVKTHYEGNHHKIDKSIAEKRPRILFLSNRFTTVLQYHTKDCMEAAKRLGCKTDLLIEADGIHRILGKDIFSHIAQFQPDIIWDLDDFRFFYPFIPQEIVWITWIQDPANFIMDPETPLKLTDRDFALNHFTTWKKFKAVGYNEKVLIDAPIPANSWIYKPYALTHEEKEQYTCDICFVCHASDAEQHIQEIMSVLPIELHKAVRTIYENYQGYVYETGDLFYEEDLFVEYIRESMQRQFNSILSDYALQYLSHDMYQWFNQRVFRQALVDWILDAGFTNIKLWGNGWKNSPKYEKYAMGPAQNGETLSKIYQASKIVVGNNVQTTSAARAWETMLSGGFYMSNYIPPESDVTDIRKIIEADKDVVMFYNREDLIQKIHYYLEHEEARQEMIERGRKVALEKMTFDKLMERTLSEVARRLEA